MEGKQPDQPFSLMGELRRRKVLYTAVVYGISAFAVTEIAAFLFENFGAPDWAQRLLAALFVAGFPVAMYLSWAFDIGADGIVRAARGDRRSHRTTIAVALVLLLLATGGLFYLIFPEPQPDPTGTASSTSPDDFSADLGFEPAEKLENSIAVLPFENLSSDPDDVFFSTGVAEEVLNHLGTFRELNIIGRTSSFVFRDREYPVPKISALLGVRFLLQGSVRRYQDQVRVSTQLLDEKGVQMWSQNFDRQLTDIFAIQTEIAVEVARAVVPEITARTLELHPANLEAYEFYLKGRDYLSNRLVPEAIEALESAIELDPGFAPAHAELAIALAMGGGGRQIERARAAADTALSLQPDLLRGLAAQGLILIQLDPPDGPGAEAVLRQVLARDPNMTDALIWLSNSLWLQGRVNESEEVHARALRLDPLHPALVRNAAQSAAEMGDDRQAIAIARRAIESPENASFHPYVILFDVYSTRGQLVEATRLARERTEDGARFDRLYSPCYCMLTWAHGILGDWDRVDYWQERTYQDFDVPFSADLFKVLALRWRGRLPEALSVERERHHRAYGEQLPNTAIIDIGLLEALAGDHASAIERLSPLLASQEMIFGSTDALDARQALAWSYLQSGRPGDAKPLLEWIEQAFEAFRQQGTLRYQLRHMLHGYALNAALMGEPDKALDRLEDMVGWGWRMIYLYEQDPRWDALRENPRFQAIVEQIKADVHRQRAELEETEPHEAFVEKLDAIRAAHGRGKKEPRPE